MQEDVVNVKASIPLQGLQDYDVLDEASKHDDTGSDTSAHLVSEALSGYYLKVQRKQTAWENVRDGVLQMTFKINGMHNNSKCILCGNTACSLCKDWPNDYVL